VQFRKGLEVLNINTQSLSIRLAQGSAARLTPHSFRREAAEATKASREVTRAAECSWLWTSWSRLPPHVALWISRLAIREESSKPDQHSRGAIRLHQKRSGFRLGSGPVWDRAAREAACAILKHAAGKPQAGRWPGAGTQRAGFLDSPRATVLPLSPINRPFMLVPSALVSRVSLSLREALLVLRRAGAPLLRAGAPLMRPGAPLMRAGARLMDARSLVTGKLLSWSEGPEPALVRIEDNRAREINGALEELQGTSRDGCSCALATLWDHFSQIWGGPDHFREADDVDRNAYLNRLRQIGERMESDPAQRPYALAPAAMITYLEGFSRVSTRKSQVDLAQTVVEMIDEGRKANAQRVRRTKQARASNNSAGQAAADPGAARKPPTILDGIRFEPLAGSARSEAAYSPLRCTITATYEAWPALLGRAMTLGVENDPVRRPYRGDPPGLS
jgi:hypothetical protein